MLINFKTCKLELNLWCHLQYLRIQNDTKDRVKAIIWKLVLAKASF